MTSIDLPPNIIFIWWGPQGLVTDDEKYDIQEGIAGDELQFGIDEEDYTHYSNLVIIDLTLMDNETQYYCIVQVGLMMYLISHHILYLELLHQIILLY